MQQQQQKPFALLLVGLAVLSPALLLVVSGEFSEADKQAMLAAHNRVRENAHPPAVAMPYLTWDAALEAQAQSLANGCQPHHLRPLDTELRYEGFGKAPVPWQVVTSWYNQRRSYRSAGRCLDVPGVENACRDFLQLMADTAATVGCAHRLCGDAHSVHCLYPAAAPPNVDPYRVGTRCSSCPSTQPRCIYGLCAGADVADAAEAAQRGLGANQAVADNSAALLLTTQTVKTVSVALLHAKVWENLQEAIAQAIGRYCTSNADHFHQCCEGREYSEELAKSGAGHMDTGGVRFLQDGSLQSNRDGSLWVLVHAKVSRSASDRELCAKAQPVTGGRKRRRRRALADEVFVPSNIIRDAVRQYQDDINARLKSCCEDVIVRLVQLPRVQQSVAPGAAKSQATLVLALAWLALLASAAAL